MCTYKLETRREASAASPSQSTSLDLINEPVVALTNYIFRPMPIAIFLC